MTAAPRAEFSGKIIFTTDAICSMPDWLTKASEKLKRSAPREPDPYEIACQCESVLRGVRQERFQQAVCRKCGEALFVLPQNSYPIPTEKQPRKSKRKKRGVRRDQHSEAHSGPSGPALTERLQQSVRTAGHRVSLRANAAASDFVRRMRAIFTPFRLVLLAVLAAVSATGYWAVQSQIRVRAERTLKASVDAGFSALRERNFFDAVTELQTATEALDLLGRDDRTARHVRQMHREAVALGNLLKDPDDLLKEAVQIDATRPTEWSERFSRHFAGRWIVLGVQDNELREASDVAHQSGFAFERILFCDGQWCRFSGVVPLNAALLEQSAGGLIYFAAPLSDCRRELGEVDQWSIRFDAERAFLWTDFENLTATGLVAGESDEYYDVQDIRSQLALQAASLGIEQ